MKLPKSVTLYEVGPRDGLQNEPSFVSTKDKCHFIELLSQTGLAHIEASSFVSPKRVPQLQDAAQVFKHLPHHPAITYWALIPNLQGFEAALKARLQAVALFTAASETFNEHNIHCSTQSSLERFKPVIEQAKQAGLPIRAYVSCALGCPYEGQIAPEKVEAVCEQLFNFGVNEISLADTIGVGTPKQTEALLTRLLPQFTHTQLAMHFHDTYGQALANILQAVQMGVTRFDTSVAGLGGCPYAPGASGNVATEDVLYFLHGLGIHTGVDIYKVIQAGDWLCKKIKRKNQSKVANAMLAQFNTSSCSQKP